MPIFAVTIFTAAFLLFEVQPMIAKYILPWFGGSPGVWTTAMLFFQALLLAGYAYAHFSIRHFRPRGQAALHLALLVVGLALLPIAPARWKPDVVDAPTLQIMLLLLATVGLPFFILASTSPLLQAWFSRLRPGASPYRLYALSNTGSLLALVSYPFLVEPAIGRNVQTQLWSGGFGLFAALSAACALWIWRLSPTLTMVSANEDAAEDAGDIVKCCGLRFDQAATFRSFFSRSVSCIPSLNGAPANTRGRSSGALSFRQRCCAISKSLNAIVSPLLREPAPLVTR